MTGVRFGLGIDLHRRSGARRLYLGGELFDGEPGLEAHSDGDVVCHALADALLGAAGLGDLGQHFPDSDPEYAGMGGLDLLGRVVALLARGRPATRPLRPHRRWPRGRRSRRAATPSAATWRPRWGSTRTASRSRPRAPRVSG